LGRLAIQDFADFPREVALGIGLVQKMHAGVEPSLVNDCIARVPGGKQHRQTGFKSLSYP
jgi:hypothetical protein